MGKGFQPKLAATERPWTYAPPPSARYGLDKILRLPVFLVVGSLAQCLLSLVLPPRWAVVPLLCYLAISLVSLLLNTTTTSSTATALPRNVVPGRAAAQLPLPDGTFRASPAQDSLVVFHIGAQFNHPLGPLCPGGGATAERFDKLIAHLRARAAELGVLAVSGWQGVVDGSFSTNTTIYFEDVASLHGFAHEPLHREAWDWFAAQRFPHLGVYHETFVVPRRSYECVYLNCKPLLMGQAARLVRGGGEKGEDERWVNALVSADTPALKTQYARMGRDRNGQDRADENVANYGIDLDKTSARAFAEDAGTRDKTERNNRIMHMPGKPLQAGSKRKLNPENELPNETNKTGSNGAAAVEEQ